MTVLARHSLKISALVLTLALAACSTPPPPPPPAPPPPPPPPSVSLSPRLIEQAAAYADYVAKVQAVSPAFTDAAQVSSALTAAQAYEPKALRSGAIAYAALLALQDPAYLAGVRTFVGDAAQRRAVIAEVYKDPAYAVGFKGADSAAGRIVAELGAAGTSVYANGKAVKQAAYDVQKQPWSKVDVPNRDARLALAKSSSAATMLPSSDQVSRLQTAVSLGVNGGAPSGTIGYSVSPPYTPLVIRGLAVAALAALGEGDLNGAYMQALMTDPAADTCLNMSKLNLYQCLAVSKPNYEDVFCLGQHILIDTGACLIRASGAAMPIEPPPPPPPAVKVAVKKPVAKKPVTRKPAAAAPAKKG
jgi:hypothetical protein